MKKMRPGRRERAAGPPLGVLAALARGVLGAGYTTDVPGHMVETLALAPSLEDRRRFVTTLRALDTKAGALALTGKRVPVSWLTPSAAEALLQRWKGSRLKVMRDLAGTIASLAVASLYGREPGEWKRIGYPGPLGEAPDTPKNLKPEEVVGDETISCDVVIVGSGAGGGCVAARLASEGLDVVVLEKGGYRNEADFTHVEAEAFRDMYLYGGVMTTDDMGIRILAGCTLGGGTVINWATSWKTPRPVLEEWGRVSGVEAFVSGEIEESLDEVAGRLNVNLDSSAPAKRDQLMEEGLRKLDWHVDVMPRNVKGCTQDEACGFCTFGCRPGAKRSSLRTYLEDAADAGARMYVGADVRRVIVRDGRASGVEASVGASRLTVDARAVVVACGSIETPALLLRSGLRGRVGHNLRLHPGTAVGASFDEEVKIWGGVMQARYANQLVGPWSGGYGATLETGPLHPGAWATAIPWTSAVEHRTRMGDYAFTTAIAVLSRDTSTGRVTIDRYGTPRVTYTISAGDERRLADGVAAAGKVLEAAGAREIYSLHRSGLAYTPGSPGSHELWEEATRRAGYSKAQVTLASMHQMGSCAMGTDPSTSAVGPDNESHEVEGLFVVDGSTFPTPSGVNPMLSIYGIANRAGKLIAARLS